MQSVSLLDGSMGEELIQRGYAKKGGLWSAYALVHHPEEVKRLHCDYIHAGARHITTNTYSTVPSYLEKEGLTHRLDELVDLAGQIARESVEDAREEALILGSLPPLNESYRPDLVPDRETSLPVYRRLVAGLSSYVDILLAETMSSIDEAVTVATAVREDSIANQKPFWVALTVEDAPTGDLRSSETVEAAIAALGAFEPSAILFNCSSPASIQKAIERAVQVTDLPIGGYPNRFRPVPNDWDLDNEVEIERDLSLTPITLADWLERFVEAGASFVGGCCGIGPDHIHEASRRFNSQN